MGELKEFKLAVRLFLKAYRWRRIDPVPWTPLKRAVKHSRISLVSSAGFVPPDQPVFDESKKGGDSRFRWIPDSIKVKSLIQTHRSEAFDHKGGEQDPNLVFPIDRIREMHEAGEIGEVNHRHLSFMGSITAPGPLISQTAPEAADLLIEDGVEIALLVPV